VRGHWPQGIIMRTLASCDNLITDKYKYRLLPSFGLLASWGVTMKHKTIIEWFKK